MRRGRMCLCPEGRCPQMKTWTDGHLEEGEVVQHYPFSVSHFPGSLSDQKSFPTMKNNKNSNWFAFDGKSMPCGNLAIFIRKKKTIERLPVLAPNSTTAKVSSMSRSWFHHRPHWSKLCHFIQSYILMEGFSIKVDNSQCTFWGFKIHTILSCVAYQTVQGEALGRILMVLTNFTIGLSGKAREKPGKAGPIWRAPDASYQPEKKFSLIKFF